MSSKSLTRENRVCPEVSMREIWRRCSSVSGAEPDASSSRESATTALTGVRSSWLMLVQKRVLASLVSRSRFDFSSSSAWRATTPLFVSSSSCDSSV
ncbi:hypothetical protein SMICM17S_12051 [Streptomyces microflavus]